MNVAIWILQGLGAALFLMAGIMKLIKPNAEMKEQMGWVDDFSQGQIRLIGIAEILGSLGLILPGLLNIMPSLTAWAALGLTLLMAGASYTHMRRKEKNAAVPPLVIVALVMLGRFFIAPL